MEYFDGPEDVGKYIRSVYRDDGSRRNRFGIVFQIPSCNLGGDHRYGSTIQYMIRVAAPHKGFEAAFGQGWQKKISPEVMARMLSRRWACYYRTKSEPRWQPNLPFWVVGENKRELLCDIWQPPLEVKPSGVALIYLHGGAWSALDKDYGTRPHFRHLSAQGHVVLDVAFRLCPEVNLYEML